MNLNLGEVTESQVDWLVREIENQDRQYGRFENSTGGMRLGVACLEDEVREVRDAWREGRHSLSWFELRQEAIQVAAVAMRLVRDAARAPR